MNPFERFAKGVVEFVSPPAQAGPQGPLQVTNVTRGTVLATRLEAAHTGAKRRKGLLGRDGLAAGDGLWIAPCESVHTFFMRFPIDLVYLDREKKDQEGAQRRGTVAFVGVPVGAQHSGAARRNDREDAERARRHAGD